MSSRLRYETSIDDMMAFQEFHTANSPILKKQIFWLRLGSVTLFLILAFLANRSSGAVTIALSAAFFFGAFIPWFIRFGTRLQMRKLYSSGMLKGMLGSSRIEVTDDGLVSLNPLNEVKTRWEGIDHIASSATHTFIYNSAISAFVIPHDKISEGNIEEIVQDIEHHRMFAARLPA